MVAVSALAGVASFFYDAIVLYQAINSLIEVFTMFFFSMLQLFCFVSIDK